jgi:hypothetical protein
MGSMRLDWKIGPEAFKEAPSLFARLGFAFAATAFILLILIASRFHHEIALDFPWDCRFTGTDRLVGFTGKAETI